MDPWKESNSTLSTNIVSSLIRAQISGRTKVFCEILGQAKVFWEKSEGIYNPECLKIQLKSFHILKWVEYALFIVHLGRASSFHKSLPRPGWFRGCVDAIIPVSVYGFSSNLTVKKGSLTWHFPADPNFFMIRPRRAHTRVFPDRNYSLDESSSALQSGPWSGVGLVTGQFSLKSLIIEVFERTWVWSKTVRAQWSCSEMFSNEIGSDQGPFRAPFFHFFVLFSLRDVGSTKSQQQSSVLIIDTSKVR